MQNANEFQREYKYSCDVAESKHQFVTFLFLPNEKNSKPKKKNNIA